MNKFIPAAMVLGLCCSLFAAEAPKNAYSVTLDFPYASKYTFRGVQLAEESLQPSLEVTYTDFYAGVWTNQPVAGKEDNEFNLYVGYKLDINERLNVDIGTTMYYFPERTKAPGIRRDTYEPYIGFNATVNGFSPGVYIYHDLTLDTTTLQGQLGYGIPLTKLGTSLDISAQYGRVFVNNGSNYSYWNVSATLPYRVNEMATVYAGVSYTSNNIRLAKRDFVTFTAGVTIGF